MSEPENIFDNQELAAFVEATLKAVSEGVRNASTEIRAATPDGDRSYHQFDGPKNVDFDVAISVRQTDGTKKGLSIGVQTVGGEYNKENSGHSERVSRVSFSVPWRSDLTEKGQREADERARQTREGFARLNSGPNSWMAR